MGPTAPCGSLRQEDQATEVVRGRTRIQLQSQIRVCEQAPGLKRQKGYEVLRYTGYALLRLKEETNISVSEEGIYGLH
ncbi:hypothetical protein NDU88_003905 [Pleurodeles waltl]|uniref:Uncharacterized protein n=1 Tax=Pleurodeles waltl TaxID=8319 RepID=A0AAV7RGJ4_PLEWA|nr:hypothetical protein NDU88_003905 [Pleurodeles waltl]